MVLIRKEIYLPKVNNKHFSTVELQWLDLQGLFSLPDKNLFLGSYGPIYETSVIKFLHYVSMLLFSFSVFSSRLSIKMKLK